MADSSKKQEDGKKQDDPTIHVVRFNQATGEEMHPPLEKATAGSAGYDLYCNRYGVIKPKGKALVHTGLYIQIPKGYYGRVAEKSGVSWKQHVSVHGGVIDCDYRGEVMVIMFNHSDRQLNLVPGHKVAQLIIEKIAENVTFKEVKALTPSGRGMGGFGSTGV